MKNPIKPRKYNQAQEVFWLKIYTIIMFSYLKMTLL